MEKEAELILEQKSSEQVPECKEPLKRRRMVVYLTLLAGLLAFWGLGNHDFWDDEAFTAVYGRNLMNTGQLIGWDGQNLMGYGMLGLVNEDMITTFAPPLQYLVAGLSLTLFGDGAAGGRVLFVLIGLCSIPLVAAWFKHEFDSDQFWIVALILALSIPYLLYIRQLRYYPLALTFAFGVLWVWAIIPRAEHYRRWIVLGTAFLCLLVLSQYLYAVGTCAVIAISLIRERYRNRKNLIFLAIIILVGLSAATWAVLLNTRELQLVLAAAETDHFSKFARLMFMVPRDASRFEFFPVGMLLFGAVGAAALGKAGITHLKGLLLALAYSGGIITAISLVSPQMVPSRTCIVRSCFARGPSLFLSAVCCQLSVVREKRGLSPFFLSLYKTLHTLDTHFRLSFVLTSEVGYMRFRKTRIMHRFSSRSGERAGLGALRHARREGTASVLYCTLRRSGAPACGSRNTGRTCDFGAAVENLCIIRVNTTGRRES